DVEQHAQDESGADDDENDVLGAVLVVSVEHDEHENARNEGTGSRGLGEGAVPAPLGRRLVPRVDLRTGALLDSLACHDHSSPAPTTRFYVWLDDPTCLPPRRHGTSATMVTMSSP